MARDNATAEFLLQGEAESGFFSAMAHVKAWCGQHQWQVGVAEMALGAGMIAAGLQSGAIQMGADVVLSAGGTTGLFGAGSGAALGALSGHLLGNIGVVALGGAFAVPAVALMGGGSLILGLAGYGVGDLIQNYLHAAPNLLDLATSGSLALVGVALMVDGARRVVKDPDVTALWAAFKDNVLALQLRTPARVIDSLAGLSSYFESEVLPFLRELATNPKAAAATAALAGLGAAGGSAVAVSSVTLLGSSSLGALGLSLGLVSAPVWPIVAGGGLAVAAAYGAWRYMSRHGPTMADIAGDGLSPPQLPAPKAK